LFNRVSLLLPVALIALACAKEPAPASSGTSVATPQDVTIIATEYGYELPATPVHAGLTTITLVNHGQELHHMQLVRLTDGKTVADLAAALTVHAPLPAWVVLEGGPNGARPGSSANATLVLEPGQYAMYCRIPAPDGSAHWTHGMILGMSVLPDSAPAAPLASGDIQVGLFNFGFAMSTAPTAGTHEFAVTNNADQPHEMAIVPLAPGETMQPWIDWVEGGYQGPPPEMPSGGITDLRPGQVQNFTMTFAPGTYGLICFVLDATDGKSHVVHGMTSTFTVS
jgi:hypothetical protein